jgi:thiol-disulfide isomerase/thioredoxin
VERIRVRAPELPGRRWPNTGGAEPALADLRGKTVLLDFWTFCCVNCLHVLDELRDLEEHYADVRCAGVAGAPDELALDLRAG